MPRYRINLSYKGTNYHGWQIQQNAISVQQILSKSLSVLLQEEIEAVGCGRTDTGVHAKNYTAHFDCNQQINDFDFVTYKANCILPRDIAIQKITIAQPDFHARYKALHRTYKYFMHFKKDVFNNDYSMYLPYEINAVEINRACEILKGTKDFTSFSKLHTDVKTNICTVNSAVWLQNSNKAVFTINADRFLRNMVRAVAGTLIELGRGRMSIDEFTDVIKSADRCKAGASVPACGLFLWDTAYNGD